MANKLNKDQISTITKSDVGLDQVDNTSDLAKPISTATQAALYDKVTVVIGKGLSTNDYTTTEKDKLTSIEVGATADQTAAEIKAAYESNANTNNYTDEEKTKVAGLESSKFRGTYTSSAALPTTGNVAGSYADVDGGTVGSTTSRYIWDVNDTRWVEQIGSSTQMTASEIKTSYESNPDTNAYTDTEQIKLNGIAAGAQVNTVDSVAGKTGVVSLVKDDVGLSSVDNTSDAAKPVSTAQQTALNLKANLASPTFTGTVEGVTKAMVGLSSVDDTADVNKPVSTAQAASIATKLDKQTNIQALWSGTQAQYDAIGTKDANTIYFIE